MLIIEINFTKEYIYMTIHEIEIEDKVLMLEAELMRMDELEERVYFLENMLKALRDIIDHGFERHYPSAI